MRDIKKAVGLIAPTLRRGGVGVIPTDTIYGLAGLALNKKTVARIYKLRRRDPKKPFIILISSLKDLRSFGVHLTAKDKRALARLWPNSVSIVLPCSNKKFAYLHRGTGTLAFRYPKIKWLKELLLTTGPLISTSANFEGEPAAKTTTEAKIYFGEALDFYIDAGKQNGKPSTVVSLRKGKLTVLRQGAVKLK